MDLGQGRQRELRRAHKNNAIHPHTKNIAIFLPLGR
jgi:hypothetical protein